MLDVGEADEDGSGTQGVSSRSDGLIVASNKGVTLIRDGERRREARKTRQQATTKDTLQLKSARLATHE